jgi:asparagine synthase (glutamine-hydrolysing)
MSLPPDQFTANGKMRRMITEYMEELMPPHILKSRKQGLQSADQKLRILRQKDAIVDEWLRIYREHAEDLLIDTDKAIRELENGKLEDCEDFDLTRHIYTTCFLRYMDRVEKLCGEKSRNRILPV